jgi:hypothetical protein
MHAAELHLNSTAEPQPEGLPQDQAGDTKGAADPSTDHTSEGQPAPVHSTSAFKPDPFW